MSPKLQRELDKLCGHMVPEIERGIDYRESYVPVGFTDDGEREIYAAVTRKVRA